MLIFYKWWQKFYGAKASECERCPNRFLKKKLPRQKKYEMGRQEWEKACIESGLLLCKLKTLVKTRFVSKIIMFESCFEFKKAILLCYGKHKIMTSQQWVPKAQVWVIAKAITSCLNFIVSACAMNQSRGHWLL
jgi:hypothetical protein